MPADELEPGAGHAGGDQAPLARRDLRARALAVAGAGAILLVVVAAATSGGFALRDERGSGGLIAPKLPSYAAWILVPLLLMAVVASFLVVTQVVTGRRTSRPTRAPLWAQFLTLVIVVMSVVLLQKAGILDRFQDDSRDRIAQEDVNARPARDADGDVTRSTALGVVVTIVLVLVLTGILALTLSVLRRQRGAPTVTEDPETEALLHGVDAGIEDLSTIADPRAAVIACYARMESSLAAVGLALSPAEAPLEFLGRVLTERNVLESSASRLTSLFELARFSEHAVDESQRADALGCLRDIRRQVETT